MIPIKFEGFEIKPGFCTVIELNKIISNHLPYPYSNCRMEKDIDSFIYERMKKLNYSYTHKLCLEMCVQVSSSFIFKNFNFQMIF